MNNIKDLEDMAAMWRQLDEKINKMAEENKRLVMEVKNNKYKTTLDNLIARYRVFMILELIFTILFPVMICVNPLVIHEYRLPVMIYFGIFFLLCGTTDYYLMDRLQSIDIYNYSTERITGILKRNKKIHLIFVAVGIPIAIGAMILFAIALGSDDNILYGICIGAFIGLIIGLNQLRLFLKGYRDLQTKD